MSYSRRLAEHNEECRRTSKKFKKDDKVEVTIKVGDEIFETFVFLQWSNTYHWKILSKEMVKLGWRLKHHEIMNRYDAALDEKVKERILDEYKRIFYSSDYEDDQKVTD